MEHLCQMLLNVQTIGRCSWLVGPETMGAIGEIGDYCDELSVQEQTHIKNAITKRRREYSTGRFLSKQVLQRLGHPIAAIPTASGRQPIWPRGIIGSISHAGNLTLVLASNSPRVDGLGVDIELIDRVKSRLASTILTDQEQKNLLGLQSMRSPLTTVFSAKEAVYKAVNPHVGLMIGFREVTLNWDESGTRYQAKYVGSKQPNAAMNTGQGYVCYRTDYVLSIFVLFSRHLTQSSVSHSYPARLSSTNPEYPKRLKPRV